MRDFYQQRFNVLLCTTIIETGIDMPTANTIIINRADKFGLAQLHQLRGRVGRSHHQAYAYLLTPDEERVDGQAQEAPRGDPDDGGARLRLLPRHARPGDPRRRRSAGRIAERARCRRSASSSTPRCSTRRSKSLKAGKEPDLTAAARRHHRDQPARAGAAAGDLLHRRARAAGALQAAGQLRDRRASSTSLHEELIDRFGLLPEPAQALIDCHRLRLIARPLGVIKVDAGPERMLLQFATIRRSIRAKLIALMQRDGRYRFAGQDRVRIERAAPSIDDRVALVEDFLRRLA